MPPILRLLAFCSLFSFLWFDSFSQAGSTDTIIRLSKSNLTYSTGLDSQTESFAGEPYRIDTGLATMHYYDPVDRVNFSLRNTGILGSAHFPLVCCPEQPFGFQLGFRQYDLYRFSKNNLNFYNNTRPFTHLNFLIGQSREQVFEVTHSQNIRKKFNFGFHYMRFATQGDYQNQRTRHNDIAFTTRFNSHKRYQLKTMLIFNNVRAEENGGTRQTNIFRDTSFLSKQLVEVELGNAENKYRDILFHARQSFRLGKKLTAQPLPKPPETDSLSLADRMNDSLAKNNLIDTLQNLKNGSRKLWLDFYHELDAGIERYELIDPIPNAGYYGMFYDALISDTLQVVTKKLSLGNKFGFHTSFGKWLNLNVAAAYSFHSLEQDLLNTVNIQYADIAAEIFGKTGDSTGLKYQFSAAYSFLDYNQNDHRARAVVGYAFQKAGAFFAEVSYSSAQPDWLFSRFASGDLSWNLNLNQQTFFKTALSYRIPKHNLHASVQFYHLNGLALWNENRLPLQRNTAQQALVFELRKLFRIRHFGFDNILRVQMVSDKTYLRYPVYWGVHTLFYERYILKGSLLARVGMDIRYNSNYRGYGYFPVTGGFYLQNLEQLTYYPAMDIYIVFKVKTARLFLKMQHLNQGMFGDKGYFSAYKYAAGDRSFRLGVSWMFLD